VVGTGDILVNNQPVKTRTLETGDVIDVGGTTIVFDDEK
jgi:pSer/pThr/pTyr-binding forkhead associated (FHA) protein